jgi:glycosyltransferase involved in cell wall biosynthesis
MGAQVVAMPDQPETATGPIPREWSQARTFCFRPNWAPDGFWLSVVAGFLRAFPANAPHRLRLELLPGMSQEDALTRLEPLLRFAPAQIPELLLAEPGEPIEPGSVTVELPTHVNLLARWTAGQFQFAAAARPLRPPPDWPTGVAQGRPTVSVLVVTYNHRPYIAECLDSILGQVTDFPVEVVVADDCSTDGTRDVIRDFKRRFPHRLFMRLNPRNIGLLDPPQQKVFYEAFRHLRGDYVAIIDGDDYWSSPYKLATQVALLQAHREYSACAHNVVQVHESGDREPHRCFHWEGKKSAHTIDDLVRMVSFFHTTALLYRNVLRGRVPVEFRNRYSCDIFNTMAHAEFGPIAYFDADMAVYRAHAKGNYSTMRPERARIFNIEGLRRYNRWLGYRHAHGFAQSIYRLSRSLLEGHSRGEWRLSLAQRIHYGLVMGFYGGWFVMDQMQKIARGESCELQPEYF